MNGRVEPRRSTQISTQDLGLTVAYAERRERQKGVRYRGIYKASDGRYRSAGTFSTEERALEVAKEAERRAAEVFRGAASGRLLGIVCFPRQLRWVWRSEVFCGGRVGGSMSRRELDRPVTSGVMTGIRSAVWVYPVSTWPSGM